MLVYFSLTIKPLTLKNIVVYSREKHPAFQQLLLFYSGSSHNVELPQCKHPAHIRDEMIRIIIRSPFLSYSLILWTSLYKIQGCNNQSINGLVV